MWSPIRKVIIWPLSVWGSMQGIPTFSNGMALSAAASRLNTFLWILRWAFNSTFRRFLGDEEVFAHQFNRTGGHHLDGKKCDEEAAKAFKGHQSFFSDEVFHIRAEEHTSELQSQFHLVCRLLLEKKKKHVDLARYHRLDRDYRRSASPSCHR